MADMLARLYAKLPEPDEAGLRAKGILVKRGSFLDKNLIVSFVQEHFPGTGTWALECEYALAGRPSTCYIAVKDKQVIGFACYDAVAKGYFGPFGVDKRFREQGVGRVLMLRCLLSMKEQGYGYAIIGWIASEAMAFYQRVAGATLIEDSEPENTVYQNMIRME